MLGLDVVDYKSTNKEINPKKNINIQIVLSITHSKRFAIILSFPRGNKSDIAFFRYKRSA